MDVCGPANATLVITTSGKARRLQRQRCADRALVAFAQANDRLARHHGSAAMPPGGRKPGSAGFWLCHGCRGQPCGYMVPRGKAWCDACGNQPPPHVSAPRASAKDGNDKKGSGAGGAATGKGDGKAADNKKVQDLQAQLAAARKELAAAKAVPTVAGAGGVLAPAAAAGADATDGGDLDLAVQKARDKLKKLKELPTDLRELVAGGYDQCVTRLQDDLDAAYAARRATNPLKRQLESAEAHKVRMEKKLADAKAALLVQEEQLAALQQRIRDQQAAISDCEAAVVKAAAEVAAIATQLASESAPTAPLGSAALPGGGAPLPPAGYVSVAFAEEKWAEREQAYAAHLAQLQALVAAQSEDGTHSEAAPSEAGDIISVEVLEADDEAWRTMAKGKRRTVLRQERDALAKKVRQTLGKVTAATACPFKKK